MRSGIVVNSGSISGGLGGYNGAGPEGAGGGGGSGISAYSSAVTNTGVIRGGEGSIGGNQESGGSGGFGVFISGGALTNTGSILGGRGKGSLRDVHAASGGIGVDASQCVVFNAGTIAGGKGGSSGPNPEGRGGFAGTGLYLSDQSTMTNSGTIVGGQGGAGGGSGEPGGFGVVLNASTLTTTGLIAGGQGGPGTAGGVGVLVESGTLVNSGTISGGLGGTGALADAVQFGTVAATLVVDQGAVFDGNVVASDGVDDMLELAYTQSGGLSGLGTSITGFQTIKEDAYATWTLTGSIGGTGAIDVGSHASLTLDGAVSSGTLAFATGGDTLRLVSPGQFSDAISGFGHGDLIDLQGVNATGFSYASGSLSLLDDGTVVDKLVFLGQLSASDFSLASDGQGGTDVLFSAGGSQLASAAQFSRILGDGMRSVEIAHFEPCLGRIGP